ncbi:DUF2140 family protein [Tumebacillus permanentifrigoris]|uniref:Uncharacterized protein YpmS n=1 Tax=Tumebacillus permanentifrigoris TaxID=378543 RepID=A0A316DB19_9BACL|nr:DUF2140 family protein [Tumebacillus permanentifrigoris]PWK13806.1 uncharacterized protein YpmS [Tumebacillus permanentifrigoris]
MSRFRRMVGQNPWRTAFWALAGLVLVAVLLVGGLWFSVTSPTAHPAAPSAPSDADRGIPIEATIPLQSINQFVDRQLHDKETPLQAVELSFEQKLLRVDSQLMFFGRAMDMRIWMRPELQANGDVRLVAEESKIGNWSIPLKTLFGVLEGLPWPSWVHIQPEQHLLDVKLSEKDNSGGARYRVSSIDAQKALIQLQILLEQ